MEECRYVQRPRVANRPKGKRRTTWCCTHSLNSEQGVELDVHLCDLLQEQRPPLHPLLHLLDLLLVLLPALQLLLPAQNTQSLTDGPAPPHLTPPLLLLPADVFPPTPPPYLNSRSLLWWVCDRARWGSLAWARLDTTRCSFFSLCLCFSLQRSSSSSAFFLCSSTFLLRGDSPVTRAGGYRVGQG